MKILILSDHYPLSPRIIKVRDSLLKLYPGSDVKVLAWNRNNVVIAEDYVDAFNQQIGYGKRLRKALNLIRYIIYAKSMAKRYAPNYIHAIDFEMLLVAVLIRNKSNLIYEVFDIKYYPNRMFNQIREKLELFIINRFIQGIILASPFFPEYYSEKGMMSISAIVLNNKPSKDSVSTTDETVNKYNNLFADKAITIGFIGTIRYKEILLNLIEAANSAQINVLLAGDGPDFTAIKEYIDSNNLHPRIKVTGRYSLAELPSIYQCCDYIWAAYPNKDLNVKYAVSNKFFEAVVFRKKIIVSEKTMLGEIVEKTGIGYAVDPNDTAVLTRLFSGLPRDYEYEPSLIATKWNGLFWEDEEHRLVEVYGTKE